MNKRNITIGLIILIIVVAAVGAYFVLKGTANTANTTMSTPSVAVQPPTTTSNSVIQTKTDAKAGQYLADANNNALYTYGGDTSGVSNCNNTCLYSWPVYAATNAPATLPTNVTVVKRTDGTSQYAYKGMPLYTFSSDSAGQVTGDGVSNFHIAKP